MIIIIVIAVIHGRQVEHNLGRSQWEDRQFIQHNQVNIHSLGDCFVKAPLWGGLYRPLTTNLYFYLGRRLFDNRIEVHHVINIVMYLINGLLLYWICLKLLPNWWVLAPPILLVSCFSHVEIVSNCCEFQSLLAVFFTLLSLGFFISARITASPHRIALSLVFYVLALLSKETSVALPGILICFGLLFDNRSNWRHYLWHPIASVIWALLFITVFREIGDSQTSGFNYDFSITNLSNNLTAYLLTFSNFLTFIMDSIAMDSGIAAKAGSWFYRLPVLGLGLACGIYAVFHRRLKDTGHQSIRLIVFGLMFFFCAIAPYVILQDRLFMRYAYLAHCGLAIAEGLILREMFRLISGVFSRIKTPANIIEE